MATNHRALDTLPLSEFRPLDYVLANADIVALYSAAAWCPQSTIPTQKLKEVFPPYHHQVLPPETENLGMSKKTLAIVYISSDDSEEQMMKYATQSIWIVIPHNSKDRNDL